MLHLHKKRWCGYVNQTAAQSYTVEKATSAVALTLNNVSSGITTSNPKNVSVNASLVTGVGTLSLYMNDILLVTGNSPLLYAANLSAVNLNNNPISNALNEISRVIIPGIGVNIIWIVIMIAIAIGVTNSPFSERAPSVAFGIIVFLEVMMLILGTLLGILTFGIILAVLVAGIIIIGIWSNRFFNPDRNPR